MFPSTKRDPIRYFTKAALIAANAQAIKTNRNRTLEPEALSTLRADLIYPIVFSMLHNDIEMRVAIIVGDVDKPEAIDTVYLDVPLDTYGNLPIRKPTE